MTKLPRDLSGERAAKAFGRAGFLLDHQTGSHMIMLHPDDPTKRLVIPAHQTLKPGLLRKLLKDAGLSLEEFVNLV